MGVGITRESDGRVSVSVKLASQTHSAVVSPVEARLLAIKLLLAAEELEAGELAENRS